jgi:hypothetical protein
MKFAPLLMAATLTGCATAPQFRNPAEMAPQLHWTTVGKSEFFSSSPLTKDAYITADGRGSRTRTDFRCGRDRGTLGVRSCALVVQIEHNGTTALDMLDANLVVQGQPATVPARLIEFGVDSCSFSNCRSTSYLVVDLDKQIAEALMQERTDTQGELTYQLGAGELQFVGRLPNSIVMAMATRVAQP